MAATRYVIEVQCVEADDGPQEAPATVMMAAELLALSLVRRNVATFTVEAVEMLDQLGRDQARVLAAYARENGGELV